MSTPRRKRFRSPRQELAFTVSRNRPFAGNLVTWSLRLMLILTSDHETAHLAILGPIAMHSVSWMSVVGIATVRHAHNSRSSFA